MFYTVMPIFHFNNEAGTLSLYGEGVLLDAVSYGQEQLDRDSGRTLSLYRSNSITYKTIKPYIGAYPIPSMEMETMEHQDTE